MEDYMLKIILNDKLIESIQHKSGILTKEQFIESDQFKDFFCCTKHLQKAIDKSPVVEYTDNFFTKTNLINTNYNDLRLHDFEKFFYMCNLWETKETTGEILHSVMNGGSEFPVILKGSNNVHRVLSGNIQLMAMRILGIFPLAKEISFDVEMI